MLMNEPSLLDPFEAIELLETLVGLGRTQAHGKADKYAAARYVLPGHFQTTCDDKSGYQHVLLHPSSQTYFGFQWYGFFFVFRTIPFGWKASAFIYHKLGLAVSGAVRSLGVPASQYIDDRQVRKLFIPPFLVSRTEPKQPLTSCVICSLRLDISSV